LVIVIGGHLGLWLLLMRPATFWRASAQDNGGSPSVLELRFIRTQHSTGTRPLARSTRVPAYAALIRVGPTGREKPPRALEPALGRGFHSGEDRATPGRIVVRALDLHTIDGPAGGNGGFMARLHAAQRADVVHGVPGSDTTYVPGIHLIDPMDQGIGAVMRTTQRAFGITSRHCIDVDVWKHLTLGQLSARHVSPDDVARAEAKYHCDAPMGLHF
jgi:hypothetical protein